MVTAQARRKRASTATHGATEFSFNGSHIYADKDEYVAKKLIFEIKKVEFQEKAGFEGSARWAITVSPKDGRPDEIITLQSNDGRDEQLYAAQAHLARGGAIRNVRLTKSGKPYYLDTVREEESP